MVGGFLQRTAAMSLPDCRMRGFSSLRICGECETNFSMIKHLAFGEKLLSQFRIRNVLHRLPMVQR